METTNLQISKQLKEKGFPQNNSHAYWVKNFDENKGWHLYFIGEMCGELDAHYAFSLEHLEGYKYYASPTADEILELLPIEYKAYRLKMEDTGEILWLVSDKENKDDLTKNWERSETLVDAAAKMWLYLKDNDL